MQAYLLDAFSLVLRRIFAEDFDTPQHDFEIFMHASKLSLTSRELHTAVQALMTEYGLHKRSDIARLGNALLTSNYTETREMMTYLITKKRITSYDLNAYDNFLARLIIAHPQDSIRATALRIQLSRRRIIENMGVFKACIESNDAEGLIQLGGFFGIRAVAGAAYDLFATFISDQYAGIGSTDGPLEFQELLTAIDAVYIDSVRVVRQAAALSNITVLQLFAGLDGGLKAFPYFCQRATDSWDLTVVPQPDGSYTHAAHEFSGASRWRRLRDGLTQVAQVCPDYVGAIFTFHRRDSLMVEGAHLGRLFIRLHAYSAFLHLLLHPSDQLLPREMRDGRIIAAALQADDLRYISALKSFLSISSDEMQKMAPLAFNRLLDDQNLPKLAVVLPGLSFDQYANLIRYTFERGLSTVLDWIYKTCPHYLGMGLIMNAPATENRALVQALTDQTKLGVLCVLSRYVGNTNYLSDALYYWRLLHDTPDETEIAELATKNLAVLQAIPFSTKFALLDSTASGIDGHLPVELIRRRQPAPLTLEATD